MVLPVPAATVPERRIEGEGHTGRAFDVDVMRRQVRLARRRLTLVRAGHDLGRTTDCVEVVEGDEDVDGHHRLVDDTEHIRVPLLLKGTRLTLGTGGRGEGVL